MEFNFEKNLKEFFKYSYFKNIKVYSNPLENNETKILSQLDILNIIANEINNSLANRNFKDIFLTASTGSGKSLLFQLPSIDLYSNGLITLVITPLKALMKDQVEFLKSRNINFTTFINSDDTYLEREEKLLGIKKGKYSLIYISPEFLVRYNDLNLLFNFENNKKIGFYVLDEAHCVSTWGKNFRPDYWFIGKRFKKWREEENCNAPILALTATAVNSGDFDSVSDIIEILNLKRPHVILSYIKRENINIKIEKYEPEGKYTDNKKEEFVAEKIQELLQSYKKIIIYHPFRSSAKRFKNFLNDKKIKAEKFVGEMDKIERNKVYNLLKEGKINCIIATKAFGIGINIDDIDCIYHYAINKSLTDYVQEIGRAGRDENIKSLAITHFNPKDLKFTRILNYTSALSQWQLRKIIEKILYIYNLTYKTIIGKWIIIYPETFLNIFKETDDIEKKVKTALLLIEKDFEEKYGLPYITFSIPSYSKVYCSIDRENFKKLESTQYLKCFTLIREQKDNIRNEKFNEEFISRIYDIGDIWELDLEKLWKDFLKNENLGSLRAKFFSEKGLIEGIKIFPRIHLIANLKKIYKFTEDDLTDIINKLEEIFYNFGNKYFYKDDLEKELKEKNLVIENLAEIILSFFKIENNNVENNQKPYSFIFEKFTSDRQKQYRIIKNKIYRFKNFLMKNLKIMFVNNQEFDYFIPINTKDKLIFMGFLELFNLATFQVFGSTEIAFNIYVADPIKIQDLLKSGYKNILLHNLKEREENEILLIKKFAEEYINSENSWNFIENYFLGHFNYNNFNHSKMNDAKLEEEKYYEGI